MNTKSDLAYPFPKRILVLYLVFSALSIGIFALIFRSGLARFAERSRFYGFLAFIAITVIFFLLFVVVAFILAMSSGKTIYRSRELIHITKWIAWGSVAALIIMILFIKLTHTPYSFYKYACLVYSCLFPILYKFIICTPCNGCGLLNTTESKTTTETLDSYTKSHTEGGYYKDVTIKGEITRVGEFLPTYRTETKGFQYVPEKKVFDGRFEDRRYTTVYTCKICGKSSTSVSLKTKRVN